MPHFLGTVLRAAAILGQQVHWVRVQWCTMSKQSGKEWLVGTVLRAAAGLGQRGAKLQRGAG